METVPVVADVPVSANPALDVNPIVVLVVEIAAVASHVRDAWVVAVKLVKGLAPEVVAHNAQDVGTPVNLGVTGAVVLVLVPVEDAKPLVLGVADPGAQEDALVHVPVAVDQGVLVGATLLALGAMVLVPGTVIPPVQMLALQDAPPLVRTLVLGTVPVRAAPTVKPLVKTPVVPPVVLPVILLVKVLASGKHPILYNLLSPVCFYLTSENFKFSKGAYV